MSTVTVCELLDPGDDVLGLVVDELVDAVTLDELPLVVARVDSNDSVSSCDGVLASEMAETSSSSGNNNDLAVGLWRGTIMRKSEPEHAS